MSADVVTSIEQRRPFIGGGDERRGGKKSRKEVRSCGN
jgi:hypothetical protein